MRCYTSHSILTIYLSSVCHSNRRINHKHITNILQSRTISLQVFKGKSATKKRFDVLRLQIKPQTHPYIVLKHACGVLHHGLVIAQLLVARSSVIIAGQQRVGHLRALSSALDGLGVLQMRDAVSRKRSRWPEGSDWPWRTRCPRPCSDRSEPDCWSSSFSSQQPLAQQYEVGSADSYHRKKLSDHDSKAPQRLWTRPTVNVIQKTNKIDHSCSSSMVTFHKVGVQLDTLEAISFGFRPVL